MLGGISIWQLLIVLVIVVLIFGTKKLRGLSGDLGGAVKDYKKAIKEEDKDSSELKDAEEEVTSAKVTTDKEAVENK